MKISYRNQTLEKTTAFISLITAIVVTATFVLLFGFDEPLFSVRFLHIIQIVAFLLFLAEKTIRFVNATSKFQFLHVSWFDIPLLLMLIIMVLGSGVWFARENPAQMKMLALGIYLIAQVVTKVCKGCVNIAASGRNPANALIATFLVLILAGAGMLMLPKSYNTDQMSFTDALFTATSATCVTGLIVKNTGKDFSLMGQIVILTLIQLGGLGIVIFGAVLSLLLGQALTVRESVAMQDLLNERTLGRIGNIIGFIFVSTILIEAAGTVGLLNTWQVVPDVAGNIQQQWFCSIFHSISAFCNAGFSLFDSNLMDYRNSIGIYTIIAPLIILGGLGFGVLYNIADVTSDTVKRYIKRKLNPSQVFEKNNSAKVSIAD